MEKKQKKESKLAGEVGAFFRSQVRERNSWRNRVIPAGNPNQGNKKLWDR